MTGDSFSFGRYNSVDDWGLMVIAYDYLLPPKRARKITIPGRSGSYDFGAKNWEERTLRMTCTGQEDHISSLPVSFATRSRINRLTLLPTLAAAF